MGQDRTPLIVGCWRVDSVPAGWEIVEGLGIRTSPTASFPSSIVLSEDVLSEKRNLAEYVEAQVASLAGFSAPFTIERPRPRNLDVAGQVEELVVEHPVAGRPAIVQHQVYVQIGRWVGIATLTTVAPLLEEHRLILDEVLDRSRPREAARERGSGGPDEGLD